MSFHERFFGGCDLCRLCPSWKSHVIARCITLKCRGPLFAICYAVGRMQVMKSESEF